MSFKPFSLANVAAFRDLPPEALRSLEDRLQPVPVRRGDCIVRQGEDADALHIVVLGRFAVEIDGDDEPVAEISHGSTIGEIAFFAGGPRTATVRAIRDGVVVRLSRDDFNSISKTTPAIWAAITSTLAERLATETRRRADLLRNGRFSAARPRPRTISVVGVCDEHIPPEFLRSFSEAARARPGTIVISSDTLDDVLGRRANDDHDLTEALNALETRYSTIVFVADREHGARNRSAKPTSSYLLQRQRTDQSAEPFRSARSKNLRCPCIDLARGGWPSFIAARVLCKARDIGFRAANQQCIIILRSAIRMTSRASGGFSPEKPSDLSRAAGAPIAQHTSESIARFAKPASVLILSAARPAALQWQRRSRRI
jgi:CRP-like cAMP-binding protein